MSYDPLLKVKFEIGGHSIGFADDLALMVIAAKKRQIIRKASYALQNIKNQLKRNGLK